MTRRNTAIAAPAPASDPAPARTAGPGRPKDLAKRAAILEAAKQLFLEQGYQGVSMDQIAATAGVSKLTVYSHFGDKETLFAATITAWWPAIEVTIATGVTNARTEAANTAIKHIKRTGRGYRHRDHYQARILLRSAHRARQHRLTSQDTTAKCE